MGSQRRYTGGALATAIVLTGFGWLWLGWKRASAEFTAAKTHRPQPRVQPSDIPIYWGPEDWRPAGLR